MCESGLLLGAYIWYITIPPVFILLSLGALILFSDFRKSVNRVYFLITLFLAIWAISDASSFKLVNPLLVNLADRISSLGMLAAAFIILFLYIFPENKSVSKKIVAVLFGPLALFFLVVPTKLYILETGPSPACETMTGSLYSLQIVLILYYIVCGIFIARKKFKTLEGVQHKQFKFFVTASILILLFGIFIDIIPTLIANEDIILFTPYSTAIFASICAFAIVKYKALNTKLIGTEALSVFLMVSVGALLFVSNISMVRVVVAITLVLASIVSFFLIRSVGKEIEQKEELARVNEDLKRLDQAKSEFLNIASHQLRTPVSVIRSVASMFAAGDMENVPLEQRKKFYDSILFKSEKLETIIHDILNATSLTAKKYNVMDKSAEAINLRILIDDIVKDFSVEVRDRELELTLLPESESVPEIRGQKEYLKEVFINLITNAIKYTPSAKQTKDVRSSRDDGGKGTIELSIENDKDTAGNVLIKVMDNGIGIPDDEKAKLFQKFQRAQNARNMYTDGTGIGLFVIKEIVEGHRGKVWFESELGKGTTFFVSLPIIQKGEVNVKEFITENATA